MSSGLHRCVTGYHWVTKKCNSYNDHLRLASKENDSLQTAMLKKTEVNMFIQWYKKQFRLLWIVSPFITTVQGISLFIFLFFENMDTGVRRVVLFELEGV